MKIIIINDAGEKEVITCRKIEPATLSRGRLIIDEDRAISLDDVLMIIN